MGTLTSPAPNTAQHWGHLTEVREVEKSKGEEVMDRCPGDHAGPVPGATRDNTQCCPHPNLCSCASQGARVVLEAHQQPARTE